MTEMLLKEIIDSFQSMSVKERKNKKFEVPNSLVQKIMKIGPNLVGSVITMASNLEQDKSQDLKVKQNVGIDHCC